MLVQQLSYLEDLSGSKAELTLDFGDHYCRLIFLCSCCLWCPGYCFGCCSYCSTVHFGRTLGGEYFHWFPWMSQKLQVLFCVLLLCTACRLLWPYQSISVDSTACSCPLLSHSFLAEFFCLLGPCSGEQNWLSLSLYVFFTWQLLGAPPVEVSVFGDVDEEVLARLLVYMGQFINGCCSAGDTQKCTHDFFNEFVMWEFFVQGSDDFCHVLWRSLQQSQSEIVPCVVASFFTSLQPFSTCILVFSIIYWDTTYCGCRRWGTGNVLESFSPSLACLKVLLM